MNEHLLPQGRSGCLVQILKYKNQGSFVRKTSASLTYNSRLIKQALKQQAFKPSTNFKAASIIRMDLGTGDSLAAVEMEYIQAKRFNEYFEELNKDNLFNLKNKFIEYFNESLSSCDRFLEAEELNHLVYSKASDLLLEVKRRGIPDIDLEYLDGFFGKKGESSLPLGSCHGDFTFSNMLFNSKIYLLDFLDSYLDSPLVDMVKFRQDTKFHWSLFIAEDKETFNKARIVQVLNYLDKELLKYFNTFQWFSEWYPKLELLNLIRILPYLNVENEIKFVCGHINSEINNTRCR